MIQSRTSKIPLGFGRFGLFTEGVCRNCAVQFSSIVFGPKSVSEQANFDSHTFHQLVREYGPAFFDETIASSYADNYADNSTMQKAERINPPMTLRRSPSRPSFFGSTVVPLTQSKDSGGSDNAECLMAYTQPMKDDIPLSKDWLSSRDDGKVPASEWYISREVLRGEKVVMERGISSVDDWIVLRAPICDKVMTYTLSASVQLGSDSEGGFLVRYADESQYEMVVLARLHDRVTGSEELRVGVFSSCDMMRINCRQRSRRWLVASRRPSLSSSLPHIRRNGLQ